MCVCVCVCQRLCLLPASIIDNRRLTLAPDPSGVCVCVFVRPVCRAGAPVTQGHSCETPLIPVLRVFWVGGWSPSTAQSYSLWLLRYMKQHRCRCLHECVCSCSKSRDTFQFVFVSDRSFFPLVKTPDQSHGSLLMPCSTIYMVRWVIGLCILLQSYACLKGFTDYGFKPLPSPQNDQFRLEWLLCYVPWKISD